MELKIEHLSKPYTSAMEKADLTVILCLQTGRLKY